MPDVEDCRILPTNSLYVLDGMIMKEPEVKHYLSQKSKVNPPPKTIDIVYQHCKSTYYVSHKYTKDEGGSQGKQYKDLQRFIEHANLSNEDDTYFIAIGDGNFYLNQNGHVDISRINRLKKLANNKNVFACRMEELQPLMEKLK